MELVLPLFSRLEIKLDFLFPSIHLGKSRDDAVLAHTDCDAEDGCTSRVDDNCDVCFGVHFVLSLAILLSVSDNGVAFSEYRA